MRWKLPADAEATRRRALVRMAGCLCLWTACATQAQPGGGAEIDVALDLYRMRLFQTATRLRSYPAQALEERLEGTTGLELVVAGDGRIKTLRVTEPSGQAILDQQAQALVRAAVPLTQIPLALQNKAFAIRLAIAFRLPG